MLLLEDCIDAILDAKTDKSMLKNRFYKIADTPNFLKDLGLKGDFFTIRYGVISHHKSKDADHNLNADEWREICKKIVDPICVTRYDKDTLNLYLEIDGRTILVSAQTKSFAKDTCVNAIRTAFVKRLDLEKCEVIWINKTARIATSEQG